jgi:hypothetical protein
MRPLTDKMIELLLQADLASGKLVEVPLGTMYGLEARGLIPRTWRGGTPAVARPRLVRAPGPRSGISTSGGRFPHFTGVVLTATGVRLAWLLQGKPMPEQEIAPIIEEAPGDEIPLGGMWIRPRRRA